MCLKYLQTCFLLSYMYKMMKYQDVSFTKIQLFLSQFIWTFNFIEEKTNLYANFCIRLGQESLAGMVSRRVQVTRNRNCFIKTPKIPYQNRQFQCKHYLSIYEPDNRIRTAAGRCDLITTAAPAARAGITSRTRYSFSSISQEVGSEWKQQLYISMAVLLGDHSIPSSLFLIIILTKLP